MKFTTSLFLLSLASPALAQEQTWIRQFGTSDSESAGALAADGAGNVFIAGHTSGSLGGANAGYVDAWLACYDGSGNRTWIRQFGTIWDEAATALVADGAGGLFIAGYTHGSLGGAYAGGGDAWLARYDGVGNRAWIRQFGTTDADYALALAPDGTGGVFIAGTTGGSLGGAHAGLEDPWLARYDSSGSRIWITQFGTTEYDHAIAVAPDGSGGAFVAGGTWGSLGGASAGGGDVWLARHDSSGTQTWIRQYGTTATDRAKALAPDGAAGVLIAGNTGGSLGGASAGHADGWLARHGSDGNQTWIVQFGTSADDLVAALRPDGWGGVLIAGTTWGDLAGTNAGFSDAWLARFGPSGKPLWTTQLGTSDYDEATTVEMDATGGLFVAGHTFGALAGTNAGAADAWLARYEDCVPCTSFCTAKSGLACGPVAVAYSGVPSASASSGFVVSAGPARTCKSGILLYNTTRAPAGVPFEGGTLCVTAAGVRRAGPTSSMGTPGGANCDGQFALDMNAFAQGAWAVPDCAGQPSGLPANNAAAFLTSPGQSVCAQFWGRDSVATGSFLSNGLEYAVGP